MKLENELRLARLASIDVRRGGAFARMLANRACRLTGSTDALDIVDRVYTRPLGTACYDCRECGQTYLTACEAAECCQFDEWTDED